MNSLEFSRDGSVLCCASDDESIRIYNMELGTESMKLNSKKYGVDLVKFTNSNRTVLHASKKPGLNDTIRYLSLGENSYLRYFKGHQGQIVSLSVSPSDDGFLSAAEDNTVRLWDLRSTNALGTITKMKRISACFDPAGIVIAVASSINTVNLYDRRAFDKEPFAVSKIERPPFEWSQIEIDRSGKYIYALTDRSALLIDAFDGKLLEEFHHPNPAEYLTSLAMSPDSEYLTAGTSDGKMLTWKARSPAQPLLTLEGHKAAVMGVKWNPTKAIIASGDTQVRFWIPSV